VLLARTDAGYARNVSVKALAKAYGLTTLREYQHGARRAINMQRMTAAPNVKQWPYGDGNSVNNSKQTHQPKRKHP